MCHKVKSEEDTLERAAKKGLQISELILHIQLSEDYSRFQKWILGHAHCTLSIIMTNTKNSNTQGAKKIILKACHSGKLKLTFTSTYIISTSPKHFLISRTDFILLFKFLKKHHLPIRQKQNSLAQRQNPIAPGFRTLLSLHTEYQY